MSDNTQDKRRDAGEFLCAFKTAMEFGRFHLLERQKNMQALADLGLTIDGMKEILAELTPDNYCAGPEPEHDDPTKEVWFFGYDLDGIDVYIKLRVAPAPGRKGLFEAIVWSFHEAKRPLRFPLRGD